MTDQELPRTRFEIERIPFDGERYEKILQAGRFGDGPLDDGNHAIWLDLDDDFKFSEGEGVMVSIYRKIGNEIRITGTVIAPEERLVSGESLICHRIQIISIEGFSNDPWKYCP